MCVWCLQLCVSAQNKLFFLLLSLCIRVRFCFAFDTHRSQVSISYYKSEKQFVDEQTYTK